MTHVIAWKTEKEVFMVADTAITTSGEDLKLDLKESSFGTKHFINNPGNKKVEERVVKLFLIKGVAVGLAGNYALALQVITTFYENIKKNIQPKEALEHAIFFHRFPKGKSIQLIIGYYDNGPQTISFNEEGDFKIVFNSPLIQIGNPLPVHKEYTSEWVNHIKLNGRNPEINLASFLGIVQSYNVFSSQIHRGIGGAFCGLYIEQGHASWQSDILYIVYGGEKESLVGTFFRDERFIISSPILGQSRCLMSHIMRQSQEELYRGSVKAIEKAESVFSEVKFNFVVILARDTFGVIVIDMNKKRKHDLLWLKPAGNSKTTSFVVFPSLKKILLTMNSGLTVIPYIKSKQKYPVKNKIEIRHIDYN